MSANQNLLQQLFDKVHFIPILLPHEEDFSKDKSTVQKQITLFLEALAAMKAQPQTTEN